MFKDISKIAEWGGTSDKEESKLNPQLLSMNSGVTYEGGLSSSSLLPPSATHTKIHKIISHMIMLWMGPSYQLSGPISTMTS